MPKIEYYTVQFWEQRYKSTICQQYQWYCSPGTVWERVEEYIDVGNVENILELGCGTSNLGIEVIKNVKKKNNNSLVYVGVDFSKQLIKKQKIVSSKSPFSQSMSYAVGDIQELCTIKGMQDSQQKFDIIIDKGTLDCIFCQNDFIKQVLKTMMQCYKILKAKGAMIIISSGAPKIRKYLLKNKLVPFSKIVCLPLHKKSAPDSKNMNQQPYFIYVCFKGELDALENGELEGEIIHEEEGGQEEEEEEQKFENLSKEGQKDGQREDKQVDRKQNQEKEEQFQQQPQNKNEQRAQEQDENRQAQYDMEDDFQAV